VNLTYDALGRMVEQNNAGVFTEILYSPIGKLAVMHGQTFQRIYVPFPGGGFGVNDKSLGFHNRHVDWLRSERFGSTLSRILDHDNAFAPYGENYAGAGARDLDFTGQDQDTVSGMYDFLFREYSPVQGRWVSPDPAGLAAVDPSNPQSWNRYAYVLNNPLSYTDPLGLECVWQDGSFDSADDPHTGSATGCGAAGGTWYDPTDFAKRGLGDWNPNGNTDLAKEIENMQGGDDNNPTFQTEGTAPMPVDSGDGFLLGSTVIGEIRSDDPVHCAAAIARGSSLASKGRIQGDNMMGKAGQRVLDNTFSGLVDFYDTAKTATNAAPVYWALFLNGERLGLPGGGTIGQGALGSAQEFVLKKALSNVGKQAAAQAARNAGNVKIVYDLATFASALSQCF